MIRSKKHTGERKLFQSLKKVNNATFIPRKGTINYAVFLSLSTAKYIVDNKETIYTKAQLYNFIEDHLNETHPGIINEIIDNMENYGFLSLTRINELNVGL